MEEENSGSLKSLLKMSSIIRRFSHAAVLAWRGSRIGVEACFYRFLSFDDKKSRVVCEDRACSESSNG